MPWVKRESIKVRRGYGKPVLERKQNWEEKEKKEEKSRSRTPKMDAEIKAIKRRERQQKSEERERKRVEKLRKKKEFRRKMEKIKGISRSSRSVGSSDMLSIGMLTGEKKPSSERKQPKYIIRGGKAYPVARSQKKKKKKDTDFDMKGFMKEMSDATKEFKL